MAPRDRTAQPLLKPAAPIIRASDAAIWTDATAAMTAAQSSAERTMKWSRAAYRREKERGRAEGRAEGAIEAARLAANLATEINQYLNELERTLPATILEIVKSILGTFEPTDLMMRSIRQGISELGNDAEVCLHVAPQMADYIRQALSTFGDISGARDVRIMADSGIALDSCVLRRESGDVDIGIAAQLRALREGLQCRLSEAASTETNRRAS